MSVHREHQLYMDYRRRMRGVRVRWLVAGLLFGVFTGVLLTLVGAGLLASRIPTLTQRPPGVADVSVVISEAYLNREAAKRIAASYPTGIDQITLVALVIDLAPGNQMSLRPTFRVDAGIAVFDVNVQVSNRLLVQDGRLVINMVGDPQLGDLTLPLDVLPFDLRGMITEAVDGVNNDLLISEINYALRSNVEAVGFTIIGVSTDEIGLVVGLQQQ